MTDSPAVAATAADSAENTLVPASAPSASTAVDGISTVITSVVTQLTNTFSGNSPVAPQVDSPANWLLLAAARRQPLAAATAAAQVATPVSPTLLVLNGYNVVADSIETIDSFTGPGT